MFKLDRENIISAITYAVITLGLTFVLSAAESIIKAGSIFGINWHAVVDQGAMAVLPVFVGLISIVKNLLTTNKGNFLGIATVIPDKDY